MSQNDTTGALCERWGPPLEIYLKTHPEAKLDFPLLPSEATIRLAIDDLLENPKSVSYTTLESIMATYVTRNSSNDTIFEHGFSFLGLHVLALVLQVGLLDCVDGYLKRLPHLLVEGVHYEWDTKAPALNTWTILSLTQSLTESIAPSLDNPGRPEGIREIEWLEGLSDDKRACLPAIGGFKYCDAKLVLQLSESKG
ncbi:hypothetical protein FRC07_006623 [Ceratobasidium sp. 392]|nr:hypothetical protein FRC07_006623 [Ceratobasidium sp. 392]